MRLQEPNPDHEMADEALAGTPAAKDAESKLNVVRRAANFTLFLYPISIRC